MRAGVNAGIGGYPVFRGDYLVIRRFHRLIGLNHDSSRLD